MAVRLDGNALSVTNRYDFTDFSECSFVLRLRVDAVTEFEREISLSCKPHDSVRVELPFEIPKECRLGAFVELDMLKDGKDVYKRQVQGFSI